MWTFFWHIGHFFTRMGWKADELMKEFHMKHTWSAWKTIRPPYPVSYPWTRKGCYAHYVHEQFRTCEKCGHMQKKEEHPIYYPMFLEY